MADKKESTSVLTSFTDDFKKVLADVSYEEKKDEIIAAAAQTKVWRKNQDWYNNGKSNECEIYQRGIFK
jgi:hypothetical protein